MFFLFIQQYSGTVIAIQLGKLAPYVKNLAIPTALLLIYSFLKYSIAIGRKNISIIDLLLELPIDFLCVVSTLIITLYIFPTGDESSIMLGVLLLLGSILIAIVACYLRRYVIDCRNSRSKKGYPIWAGLGLYISIFTWITLILFFAFK